MEKQQKILCIGEVLWDSMPMGLFLGGAPLNVTYHLNQMGVRAQMISRVGEDRLGKEAIRRIKYKNLQTDLIQQDPTLETGFVEVTLDDNGNPEYEIIKPVAWDKIMLTDQIQEEASGSWAVVYGSLAMRDSHSRTTILELLNEKLIKVLDINLRKPFYSKDLIRDALVSADILKLNEDELRQLTNWFSLPQEEQQAVETLSSQFSCSTAVVTKGSAGASLFHEGVWVKHAGYSVEVKDAVGAGDAFLAGLLQGLRAGNDINDTLRYANAAGAYVASNFGATPEYVPQDIDSIITNGALEQQE